MMKLDQLRYFYEASKYQHIGKAAKAIPISPSAISAAVQAIEEELGILLFERKGNTILLNSHGKLLQEEAAKILNSVQNLKVRITGEDINLKGHFRLGASHFLASNILTKYWSTLQNKYPQIVGEICSLSTVKVIEEVVAGKLDFGLCFSPFKHPELVQEKIHEGKLKIAVKKNHHLLKLSSSKAIKELSTTPCVLHKAQPGVDVCEHHEIFDQFNISVNSSLLFDSDDCAVQKLVQSNAWSLLPDIVIEKHKKDIVELVISKKWDANYSISTIQRKDRSNNEVFLKFQTLIKNHFKT